MSDTEPDELAPVLEAIEDVRKAVDEEMSTIKLALHSLRDTVLEHYQRMTARGDRQDRRLDRIERHLGLPELPERSEDPTTPEAP